MPDFPLAESTTAETHVVENTPPLLENDNMFADDPTLVAAVHREGAASTAQGLASAPMLKRRKIGCT